MKVIFAASECRPFIKTGGLADVISSLPQALKQQGVDVEVVLPRYGDIPFYFTSKMKRIAEFNVPVGWRKKNCFLDQLIYEDIKYYFIGNEYYFNRAGLYDQYDDAERFAFFSRAILEMLFYLDFKPDILHCHEWQTAPVSLFLHTHYGNDAFYEDLKTVYTLHDIKYQGIFSREVLFDVLDLDESYFCPEELEYYGQVNFLKGAVKYSDAVMTTSSSYVRKLQNPFHSGALYQMFRYYEDKLYGVVNGVDRNEFNPEKDQHIFNNYARSAESLDEKRENKLKLQEVFDLPVEKETPMLVIVSNLVSHKGLDLVLEILPELLKEKMQLVVLGVGEERLEQEFKSAAWENTRQISTHITFNEDLARKIYAAGDLFLQPFRSEPCGTSPLIALRYLTIPVIRRTGGLDKKIISFREDREQGNGFVFESFSSSELLETIRDALVCYQEQEEWEKLVDNVVNFDYCWLETAEKHKKIYQKLLT